MILKDEFDDIVMQYVFALYAQIGEPVTANQIRTEMIKDAEGYPYRLSEISSALTALENKGFIEPSGRGYVLPNPSKSLQIQLDLPEHKPFSTEYKETSEAHEDKVWDSDWVPEKHKYVPVSHLMARRDSQRWRGLIQE
jgi:hypothetical protein